MLADSRTPLNLSMEYYLGALLGCALYYLIYAAAAAAGHLSWNITFGSFVIALLLYASAPENMAVLMLSAACSASVPSWA
jgi:hypothetical protein